MARLPQVNGQRVLRALRRVGWEVIRVHGSHHVLANDDRPGETIVVPVHRRPLKKGTLADILERAKLSAEEFRKLL
ncbi:MAG: type II toxin-antitoxin system HicA family toxin [Dehalococcoidia bacterium]